MERFTRRGLPSPVSHPCSEPPILCARRRFLGYTSKTRVEAFEFVRPASTVCRPNKLPATANGLTWLLGLSRVLQVSHYQLPV